MQEKVTSTFSTIPPGALNGFAQLNPECSYELLKDTCVIHNPWGDDSIHLELSISNSTLINALNELRFPPQFSAIRHTRTNDVEFIYAPLPMYDPVRSRSFAYQFKQHPYQCAFAPASEALTQIALCTRSLGPASDANYRNLTSIRQFLKLRERPEGDSISKSYEVTSFWIRSCPLPDDELVVLSKTLNFYMRYFDRATPVIVIHAPSEPTTPFIKRRYARDTFPKGISAKVLDSFLLSLWEAASSSTEQARRFVSFYQILEYAGFYYIRETVSRDLKRILGAPDITDQYREAVKDILDIMVDERQDDESKIDAVASQFVKPSHIWPDIEKNIAFFSQDTIFEGGLVIPKLVVQTWTCNDFETAWHPKLITALRQIRNALVHAREKRASKCIMSTRANQRLLGPWCLLIENIASQLMIYGDL